MEIQKNNHKISFAESFKKTGIVVFALMAINVVWNLIFNPNRLPDLVSGAVGGSYATWQIALIVVTTAVVLWLIFTLIFAGIYFMYREFKK